MSRLKNKIALVTGATHSIGLKISELFLEHGATVILSGKRSEAEGSSLVKSIHPSFIYKTVDVQKEDHWQQVSAWLFKEYGQLDILVNNASVEYPKDIDDLQDPENCSLKDWRDVHAINLDGVFLGCKYAIPLMKKSTSAAIVNVGSRSGLVGIPSSAAYSSSKAAVRNYTKTVALYCAEKNYPIRCNVVHPAAILTKMWDKELGQDDMRPQRIATFSENVPLRRMGQSEDVAYAVLYLASDEAKFITGTELIVDGGIMAGTKAAANTGLIETP